MPLNARQQRFVAEYLKDPNATQAAIRAGYSVKTARSMGAENLTKPAIKAAVAAGQAKVVADLELDASLVLKELMRLAFNDVSKAFGAGGSLKPLREMDEDVRRCIAGYEVDEKGVKKVRFWDKTKALELLGKNLKLWTDKLDVSGKLSLEQLLTAATERRKQR